MSGVFRSTSCCAPCAGDEPPELQLRGLDRHLIGTPELPVADSMPVTHAELTVPSGVPAPVPTVAPPLPPYRPARYGLSFWLAREYETHLPNNGVYVQVPGIVAIPRGQQLPDRGARTLMLRSAPVGVVDQPAVGAGVVGPQCPPPGGGS